MKKRKYRCEEHEWVVFSTALQEGWLMLQCVQCGQIGTVDDPTNEEWQEAFYAPSRPYRWSDAERVTVRQPCKFFYVTKCDDLPECQRVLDIEAENTGPASNTP